MKKVYVLMDDDSNKYFTNDYECFWSRNMEDAYKFSSDTNMDEIINHLNNMWDEPLKNVKAIVLGTLYVRE